jgi:hypothetical protein
VSQTGGLHLDDPDVAGKGIRKICSVDHHFLLFGDSGEGSIIQTRVLFVNRQISAFSHRA